MVGGWSWHSWSRSAETGSLNWTGTTGPRDALKACSGHCSTLALVFFWWLLQQLASCKTLESTQEEGSTGFLFGTAYMRTLESCNAVKGHFAILHFSHLACCCYAYASLCSDRCNRQRASLLQALARPRLVSSDACNAAPSAASCKWRGQPCRRCSRGGRRPPRVRRTRRRRGRDAL